MAIMLFGMIFLSGNLGTYLETQEPSDEELSTLHELVVKQIDGQWRVVLKDDESTGTVYARKGDRIRWTAEGSNLSFQFDDEALFGDGNRNIRDGNTLNLVVQRNTRVGTYTYAIFVHSDLVFATGDSPPRIFVIG
ncbi:MAG: hypothetical protein EA391_11500 [Balneolaceae bacterium]|nr:MAG: hypothetical protein EA391_11500 [Balneolaceae bacterium]